jgi:hypothetical protein
MGCGCNKSRRPTRKTIVPQSSIRARQIINDNNNDRIQAQSVESMSKEQRDAERKKRIQLIISKRNIKN